MNTQVSKSVITSTLPSLVHLTDYYLLLIFQTGGKEAAGMGDPAVGVYYRSPD